MATVNLDKLFDVTDLAAGKHKFDSKKYQGLKDGGKTLAQMEGTGVGHYTYEILEADEVGENAYKKGDLKITVADGKYVYVEGYLKSNGKSKCNILVGNDYDPEVENYGDLVNDSVVSNPTPYTVANVTKQSLTTTAYNDTVDLTGFQADDKEADHYIKKGFTVKTVQGNDTITGSVLGDNINAGDGDDSITASYGNDAYTLGKGSNTATYNKANLAEGFGTDTYTLTKEETVTLNQNYDAAQVKYNVKGNDAVVDVYSKSHVGYSKVEVSYDDEATRNYFDTQKVTSKDGATIDLKVTFDGEAITKVQEWDPDLNEGVGGYAEADVKAKYTGIVTAAGTKQYQRVYAVAGEEVGTLDPDKSHLIEAVAEDFTDHTSLTYLVKTQDYEAALSDDGKKVVWNEDGVATYEAAATGKVGTTHSYTYNVGGYEGTEGTARSVSVADLKKVYVVQDTKSTAYVYDGEAEQAPYWTLGEVSVHEYAVVKKAGDETTTYYQVLTAENGAVALVETTAEVIAASDIDPEDLAVYTEDELKLGAVVFKNYASKNDATVKVGETDLATLAKHDVTLDNKNVKFTSTRLASEVDVAAGTNKALTVDLSKSQYANDNGGHNAINLVNATGKVTVKGSAQDDGVVDNAGNGTYTLGKGNNTLTYTDGNDTVNLTEGEVLAVDMGGAEFKVVKNDVIAYAGEGETITFKNFAAKDLGATVTVDETNLATTNYVTNFTAEDKVNKFTGSRLNDVVDASEFVVTKGEEAIEPVEKPLDPGPEATKEEKAAYKAALKEYNNYVKTKGVTVDLKDGANSFEGSVYADTVKAGVGNDTVTASFGDDVYTLGAGTNTADYTSATATGVDTFNLTKGEKLVLTNLDAEAAYAKIGNDIVVETNDKFVVLKNYAADKTGADVYVGSVADDHEIWDQDINILATSAKTTGTYGNDDIVSTQKSNTFVESYTSTRGFGDNTIDSSNTKADTIQITTSDKEADKLSAYDLDYAYTAATEEDPASLAITGEVGSITYTGDFSKGLNFVDATNTKWAFTNDTAEIDLDLSKAKTNNIVWTANDVTDSKKNDIIYGAGEAQTYTYTAGKDLYKDTYVDLTDPENPVYADDKYVATLDKKTTLVIDDTHTADEGYNKLDLTANKGYGLLFDVDDEGNVVDGSDVKIFDLGTYAKVNAKSANALVKDNFAAGTITLAGALEAVEDIDPVEEGNQYGCAVTAFKVKNGEEYVDLTVGEGHKTVDEIRSAVANWLGADGREYATAFDALQNGTKDELAELMTIYTTGMLPEA